MSKLNPVRTNPESGTRRNKFTREQPEKVSFSRDLRIVREDVNEKERTVSIAFSSETPVERWDGNEVLSHSAGDYDFSRLNDSHPLLLGHAEYDPASQIGVVVPGSAKVGNDKIARCSVQFSRSALGEEIFQDVKDGIRKLVSVGYDRTGIVKQDKAADGMMTTLYKWMPTHVAIVPVPADTKAGVGRDKQPNKIDFSKLTDAEIAALPLAEKQRIKKIVMSEKTETLEKPIVIVEADVRKNALTNERTRVKGITDAADLLIKDHKHCGDKIRAIVSESIANETSLGDFQIRAMKEVLGAKPVVPITMEELGMDEGEQRSYSVLRGIQSCLKRNASLPDGLEGDVHNEMVKRTGSTGGVSFEGFAVPHNARIRCNTTRRQQRDLNAGTFGQGGAFVPTQLVTPIIELLRNRMVTATMGITSLSGLSGNVAIPRQTAAATAYSLAESAPLTKSTQALDQILLAPHRVGATNDYTKQLLLQSSVDVENFIRDDLMKVIGLKWDYLILNGQGAGSEPQGILNTVGIGSVTFGAAATFAKLVAFETALAILNADAGNMGYVTTPASRGVLKSAAKLLVGATTVAAVPLWEPGTGPGEGEVNGYRALASNQILNNGMLFGNWSEVVHGLYGGYDVIVNPYSRDVDAAVRITINTFGDVALRHAASFCVSTDAANQ